MSFSSLLIAVLLSVALPHISVLSCNYITYQTQLELLEIVHLDLKVCHATLESQV